MSQDSVLPIVVRLAFINKVLFSAVYSAHGKQSSAGRGMDFMMDADHSMHKMGLWCLYPSDLVIQKFPPWSWRDGYSVDLQLEPNILCSDQTMVFSSVQCYTEVHHCEKLVVQL